MFAICVHIKMMLVHVSSSEFNPPNCGKFTVECDWNNESSQKLQNLGFFKIDVGKIDVFY